MLFNSVGNSPLDSLAPARFGGFFSRTCSCGSRNAEARCPGISAAFLGGKKTWESPFFDGTSRN